MDMIIKNASKLKPAVRLGLALSAFENSLTDDRKAIYLSYRDQARNRPPDLEDVHLVAAEIDRQSNRPLGTRFIKILASVQQMTPAVDVLIGGSQNLIASGVWGAVRLTLVVMSGISAYRESVSKLFMEIGRSAPRHKALAMLYPQSKRLQDALLEYFIIVVDLCQRLFQNSTKSRVAALVTAVFADQGLKDTKEQLSQWAQAIDREVAFLLSEGVQKEAKANERNWAAVKYTAEAETRRRKAQGRLNWLGACSEYRHEAVWIRFRKEGNATFFLQDPSYRRFKDRLSSSTLLCTGRLGSGKSVLMANMIDDLILANQERQYSVACFFVQAGDINSLRARSILGSIARQILESIRDLDWVTKLPDTPPKDLDIYTLVGLLRKVLSAGERIFVVLDGLDECSSDERSLLLGQIRELQAIVKLHLCVSLRLEASTNQWKEFDRLNPDFLLEIPQENPDISDFVGMELKALVDAGDLAVGDAQLLQEIHDYLLSGAKGMFLWVSLQLQTICLERTDQAIREALRTVPDSLPAIYDRILTQCRNFGSRYQIRILKLLAAAFRPLTADELGQCLSVKPGETSWSRANMINDIFSTLSCCGSMVVVDEEELTFHFVHPSARQFLLGTMSDSSRFPRWQFSLDEAHKEMAAAAVTYIHTFEARGTIAVQEETVPKSGPTSLLPSPAAIVTSTRQAAPLGMSRTMVGIVSRISRLRQSSKRNLNTTVDVGMINGSEANVPKGPPGVEEEFIFLSYAKEYWLLHSTTMRENDDPKVFRLWEALVRKAEYGNCFEWPNLVQRLEVAKPEMRVDHITKPRVEPALEMTLWAIITSHHVLMDVRLRHHNKRRLRTVKSCCTTLAQMTSRPKIDGKMATRLLTACLITGFDDTRFLKWLLDMNPDLSYGSYGCLYAALLVGRCSIARVLLRRLRGSQVLSSVNLPLIAAAIQAGDPRTVRLLIRRGTTVNLLPENRQSPPIMLALSRLHKVFKRDPVKLTQATTTSPMSTLQNIRIVYMLLTGGADSNHPFPASDRALLIPAIKIFAHFHVNRTFFDIHDHLKPTVLDWVSYYLTIVFRKAIEQDGSSILVSILGFSWLNFGIIFACRLALVVVEVIRALDPDGSVPPATAHSLSITFCWFLLFGVLFLFAKGVRSSR